VVVRQQPVYGSALLAGHLRWPGHAALALAGFLAQEVIQPRASVQYAATTRNLEPLLSGFLGLGFWHD